MSEWFHRGQRAESISLDDRAVQYGDGLFETVAIRDARPRMLDRHMQRLQSGCARLGIEMPTPSILQRDLDLALAQTKLNTEHCVAKLIVSAGSGPRGYRRPDNARAEAYIGLFDAKPLERSVYAHGVETLLTQSRIASAPQLAGLKTLNRLDQVVARREWDSDRIFDGVMRDADDNVVIICSIENFRDKHIVTPALEQCGVAGIMRSLIIDRLAEHDIRCDVTDIGIDEFEAADEVFLCNSQIGAVPVRRCDALRWDVGEATRSVMTLLSHDGVPECQP